MTYPTDEWPTQPVVWRSEMPRCVGACHQGRIPCQQPLLCSCTTLSNEEFDDAAAEVTDHAPLAAAPAQGELPTISADATPDQEDLYAGEIALVATLLVAAVIAWAAVVAASVASLRGVW